ncbi:MAG: FtsH protease activity modulator HflK, partial [Hyphomicrobiales bacterium]|nr:FtsH protease activity modulator HflK [Hyphomicrobiales bacterium]
MAWNDKNDSNGSGPWGSPPPGGDQNADVQEMLQRGQDKIRSLFFGGGGGNRGGGSGGGGMNRRATLFILLGLVIVWLASGFYRVLPDEQGVVLRFGKFVEQTAPGLHYHIPFPIEEVRRPKVTVVNRTDIGMRIGSADYSGSGPVRDVPEESLMLTGDENIVDVDFSVFWIIKNAENYLFNIQEPPGTVKAVAESTMREVVGRSRIQPILTEERQGTEEAVKKLMQEALDRYGAGIEVTQVKMQKVDPPAAVIDAFRDVQAARADQERIRNEAQAYQNKVVPEARGEAARIRNEALAYQE